MSIKRSSRKSHTRKIPLADLILAKYRTDPEGFSAYLPEVAEALDSMFPPRYQSRSPFGLTEHERAHRLQALENILEGLNKGQISSGEATRALEHCAVLTEDDSLPPEIGHKTLLRLLRFSLGKPVSEIKAANTITLQQDQSARIVNQISLTRGVVLDLDSNMRLVSVTVNPAKLKERRKAMRFIGIVEDTLGNSAEPRGYCNATS